MKKSGLGMTKLEERRKKKKLSRRKLFELSGVSKETINSYERRENKIDNAKIKTVVKLCEILDCKMEDILENEDTVNIIKKMYKNID